MLESIERLLNLPQYTDPIEYRKARNIAFIAILLVAIAIALTLIAVLASYPTDVLYIAAAMIVVVILSVVASLWLLRSAQIQYAGLPLVLFAFLATGFLLFQNAFISEDVRLTYEYGLPWLSIILTTILSNQRAVLGAGLLAIVLQLAFVQWAQDIPTSLFWEMAAVTLLVTAFAQIISSDLHQIVLHVAGRSELRRLQLVETSQAVLSRISSRLQLQTLLSETVEVIRDQFERVHHVQAFLINDDETSIILRASTGSTGQKLLTRRFQLPLDNQGVIGRVIQRGSYMLSDTEAGTGRPDLLSDTRTELALPLRVKGTVIGVLDLQSHFHNAFDTEDIQVFQTLADQISIAIDNARLLDEVRQTAQENLQLLQAEQHSRAEIERLNRELTRQMWDEYMQVSTKPLQATVDLASGTVSSVTHKTPAVHAAQAGGKVVVAASDVGHRVAMPITVRGITIGVIEFELPDPTPIADATLDALNILSERIGMIAENARLFEAVLQSAQYQAQLNQVTARLQGISDIEILLGTVISELGKVIGAQQGYIRLVSENTGNGQSE